MQVAHNIVNNIIIGMIVDKWMQWSRQIVIETRPLQIDDTITMSTATFSNIEYPSSSNLYAGWSFEALPNHFNYTACAFYVVIISKIYDHT